MPILSLHVLLILLLKNVIGSLASDFVYPRLPTLRVDGTIDPFTLTEPRANAKPESVFVFSIKVKSPPLIG